MGLAGRNLRQQVTYWRTTASEFGGFTFDPPVTVKGRWEDTQKSFISPSGEQDVSRSIVYIEADLKVDDYVALGTYTDADPTNVPGALPVRQFSSSTDLRSPLQRQRTAFL
jgi:hypothetical protein